MKNHAFLFTVYNQPRLLARSLQILSKHNHHFFIHVDAKSNNIQEFKEATAHIPNVHYVKNIPVYHGKISQVYSIIILLEEAINSYMDFAYFHLLSGQDYPLRSNEQFDDFFEQTDHSFMCYDFGEFKESMQPVYRRMVNHFHPNKSRTFASNLYEKLHIGNIIALIYERPTINHFASGWDWFSWNRETCKFVIDELKTNKDLLQRFNFTISPTEHIFHTMLFPHIETLKIETDNPLRYVSWYEHRQIETDYRPYDLNELDFEYIIKSKAFFCRKVDEHKSARLLDIIDNNRGKTFDVNLASSVFE